jgi:hypothetical protein
MRGALGIHRLHLVSMAFRPVHVGEGGKVDHPIGASLDNGVRDGLCITHVDVFAAYDLVAGL